MIELAQHFESMVPYLISIAGRIVLAILLFIVGYGLINFFLKVIKNAFNKRKIDPTLSPFLLSIISIFLKISLFLAIAATLGIQTASFLAILGAAGLAVGLALQGSLSNFAGTTLLLFFRPFKVGDYIKTQDVEGTVREIQVFNSIIEDNDNVRHIIPNGIIANNRMTVTTANNHIRLNVPIGISYGSDIAQARNVLLEVMKNNPLVLDSPAAEVVVTNLADSSVNLALRPWVNPANKPRVTVDLLETGKLALDKAKIEIPFPQRVVHLHNS
ncbi:MAG: mechanosensitive ion channel [Chitinophagales bacterium]|nr:mechanosensitive ion channel [Bacteroidota bacterium]MCB9042244.1 mechanosensitive ion channel [Chitinophagales bacterium]